MKKQIQFYQTQFTPFTAKNLFPKITFDKNVQGWVFTRNCTVTIFIFAVTLSVTNTTDLNTERSLAHDQNVIKYIG